MAWRGGALAWRTAQFLSYFWGPMPIMIWVAIAIELVKGIYTGESTHGAALLPTCCSPLSGAQGETGRTLLSSLPCS